MSPGKDTLEDARLIEAVLNGEVDRFELLIRRHEGTVLAILKKHLPLHQVEDMAQEVFVRAYRSLKKYKGKGEFKSWLAAISVRTCYDFWRKNYNRKEISWEGQNEKERLLISQDMAQQAIADYGEDERAREDQELLRWAMGHLSPAERMVLELVYFEELSGKEAAHLLGWSVTNVKVRTHRARKKLHRILKQKLYESDNPNNL